jgi:4-coumarate--CoA ligase
MCTDGARKGYGLTETSPATHMVPIEYALRKMGSIGMLLPNLEARIVDVEGNVDIDVEEGQPGELWVRGPTIMKVRFDGALITPR